MTRKITPCRSCGASMVWAVNPATGKRCPVNATPDQERGNIVFTGTETIRYLTKAEREQTTAAGEERHTSHFDDCKQAQSWRRS